MGNGASGIESQEIQLVPEVSLWLAGFAQRSLDPLHTNRSPFDNILGEGDKEMRRGVWRLLCTVVLVCSGVSASAQENPLQYYTADVDLIIRLREPDQTAVKVIQLVNQVQPGAGDLLEAQKSAALGAMISNPSLTGVDQSRDWYAGVYFREEGQAPVVVFAIPALRTEDLVGALGGRMKTRVEGKIVLYTDGDEIPSASSENSAARKLDETAAKALATGDLCVYVNVDHLSNVYAEQLDLLQDKTLEALNQLRFTQQQSGVDMSSVVEMYGTLAEGCFQAIEDSQNSVVSITLSDADVFIRSTIAFAADTASSQFLTKNPPGEMSQLSKLPANLPYYYGMNFETSDLTKWGLKMTAGMINDPSKADVLKEATKKLDSVKFGALMGAFDIADSTSGAFRSVGVMFAEPIDEVKALLRDLTASMSSVTTDLYTQTATIQVDAETYGDEKADVVTITHELKDEADPLGMQKIVQSVMFGESGMETRTLYRKDSYLQSLGGGEKGMRDLLKAIDGNRTNNLVKAREGLMPQANLYQFVDLAGLMAKGLRVASQVEGFPLPLNKPMIDSLGLQPSYIGMAAGSEANRVNLELRIPVSQIVGVAKLGVMIGTAAQGAQNGL